MASLFIKGTALVTRDSYSNDPTCLGSYLICVVESWVMQNFTSTGEFAQEYPEVVRKRYGEVRSASEAFQNDIHNLSIGYYQMKRVVSDPEMESGLKGLYLGNLVEHYVTNIRCIYDQIAIFSRIIVDQNNLQRVISAESLNALLKYISKNNEKAIAAFTEPVIRQLVAMTTSLENIKTIRDAIIHDGKEPMITFSSGIPLIRISKSAYKRDESLLPDLLGLKEVDYPMFPYLQHISRTLFAHMDNLGAELLNFFIRKDEAYRPELVALIGICIEDFIGFLHHDYNTNWA